MEELFRILQFHRGRKRAVTAKYLSQRLDIDERFVRSEIRRLIASGMPIASSTQAPPGYYLIETMQEAQEYMKSLRNRLIEDALRRRDFKLAVAKSFDGAGQLKLL